MCDYCTSQMYRSALTPESRLKYRLEKFIEELKRNPTNNYRCDSVANVLSSILECELGDEQREADFHADIRDAEIEEAVMHEQLEREAR